MSVDIELRFARSDLRARCLEEISALWADSFVVDDGLIGCHVAELGVSCVTGGDGGIHRVHIDSEFCAYMGEERHVPEGVDRRRCG